MRVASSLILSALVGTALSQSVLRGSRQEAEVSFAGVVTPEGQIEEPQLVAANASNANHTWYTIDTDTGLSPQNAKFKDSNHFSLVVKPDEEAVRIRSKAYYKGGKFAFKVRSAASAPGIITSVYMASGLGRKGDDATGKQDEIDLEWKGNNPTTVQTNVFLTGQEDLQLIDLGKPSNESPRLYGMEWNDTTVVFYIDEKPVRVKTLDRPLKPMQLEMSVWTTMGGWPGLIQWAGPMDWSQAGFQPVNASFVLLNFPDETAGPDGNTTTTITPAANATAAAHHKKPKADSN